MKITLYKEAPKCPKCNIPMKFEETLRECTREINGIKQNFPVIHFMGELYRCPKCLNLYKVEK